MSGARRGPERPRRNVEDEPEMYGDADANMWAEMMHQQQQIQAQQAQQHQEFMTMFQQHMNNPVRPKIPLYSFSKELQCRLSF
ncbi:hypothetical protein QL285_057899 [Trifolium repens]|nr:hypothetical protein QL285_057899 [Trifolium repens]